MIRISVANDLKAMKSKLNNLAKTQMPFATAQALTATAKVVQAVEIEGMTKMFGHAVSAFTAKSIRVQGARKSNLAAKVFVMDTAAQYLNPYEFGGDHKLAGKALFNPKNIGLNKYGQLPRGTIAKLAARPDIFIGEVKTAHGVVNGVWQRSVVKSVVANGKRLRKTNNTGKLKLLIRFGDALPVKQHWDYRRIAQQTIAATFAKEISAALSKAIATAK